MVVTDPRSEQEAKPPADGKGAEPPSPPPYKTYRSRRGPLAALRRGGDLEALRRRLTRRRGLIPRERRPITAGRALKWFAVFVAAWLALSLLLFTISAQLQPSVADRAKRALSGGGDFFSGSTILVLGSDQRKGESIDRSETGPGRADTIMLLHAAFGRVRKLSIPRDAAADIPGHGVGKINSAYAIGGPALMVQTVENFLGHGLDINHLIELDFGGFPRFIDAMGGITVDVRRKICSPPFDNFWKGLTFERGRQKLDGTRALGYARVRKNRCATGETDLDRSARQQQVLSAVRGKLLSPTTFLRLPLVSWRAPRTIRSDMRGPGLLALAADVGTGGTGRTRVLKPSFLPTGGGNLTFSEGEKADAVRHLLGR